MCVQCWSDPARLSAFFIHLHPNDRVWCTGNGRLVLTDHIDAEVPPSVAEAQSDGLNSIYLGVINSLVRTPHPVLNVHEWRLLRGFAGVPSFDAHCTFAVRVAAGAPHEVASVVLDDSGRCAMNVVFGSLEEYQAAHNAWELGRDKNIAPYAEQVKNAFDAHDECDHDLIAKTTDSFAVYVRITRRLPMYYG